MSIVRITSFEGWLRFGIEQGWCSTEWCYTHDGIPLTDYENEQFDEGGDPCVHIVRLGSEKHWDHGDGLTHPDNLNVAPIINAYFECSIYTNEDYDL
jgi:hypothetical protein